MFKTIEISEYLYERLGRLANTFETPDQVIGRLIDHYESKVKSDQKNPDFVEELPIIDKPKIRTFKKLIPNFYPTNLEEFKSLLLKEKQAWVILYFNDGSKEVHQWNAHRFTEKSDVLGNLRSGYLRDWREKGIIKADIAIDKNEISNDGSEHAYIRNIRPKSNSSELIKDEINKVQSKIPNWLRNRNQINSKILLAYLKLSEIKSYITPEDLKIECSNIKTFQSNYDQMKIISPRNHAKVFDENNFQVTLWEPVKEFIMNEYRKDKA